MKTRKTRKTRKKRAAKGTFNKASSLKKLGFLGRQLAAADTMVCESRDREDALNKEIARLRRCLAKLEGLLKAANSRLQVQSRKLELEKALDLNRKFRQPHRLRSQKV